jgi:hypothetical protein
MTIAVIQQIVSRNITKLASGVGNIGLTDSQNGSIPEGVDN